MSHAAELQESLEEFRYENPWILDLVGMFSDKSRPIRWELLQGGIKDRYVEQYLIPSYVLARNTYHSLNWDPSAVSSKDATEAAKVLFDSSKGIWDKATSTGTLIWETLNGGTSVLSDALLVFVGSAFEQLQFGYNLHASGAVAAYVQDVERKVNAEYAAGRISQIEAESLISQTEMALQAHASSVQDGLQAITYLDKEGYLDSKKQGVGEVFTTTAVVILGAIAIAAAAAVIVAVTQIGVVNNVIADHCSTFQDEGKKLACTKAALDTLPTWDIAGITGSLVKWLVVGGLVVLGVYFAPLVTRKMLSAGRELKR